MAKTPSNPVPYVPRHVRKVEDVSPLVEVTPEPEPTNVVQLAAGPTVPASDPSDPWASVRKGPKKKKPGMNDGPTNESKKRKQQCLDLIAEGWSVAEAMAQTGRSMATYAYWRQTDDKFKADIDVARTRLQVSGKKDKGWTGDFASFRQEFFPRELESPPFHYDLIRKIDTAPPQSITLINVFPNAGKSALLEDWICYKLAVDPDHRIAVVSKGTDQARKMLAFVQSRMTDHYSYPAYVARFGPFYEKGQEREGKPWTRDYLRVFKASPAERDPSLQVKGWTSQILGARLDTIILDDVQDGENLAQVDKMLDKLRREYYTRLKGGRLIVLGNRIASGDLYERMVDLEMVTHGQHFDYPAIDQNGESLWPERWPTVTTYDSHNRVVGPVGLDHVRRFVGEGVWQTTYQQRPQLAGNATFDEQMIEDSKDWTRRVGATTPGERVVLSVDPGMNPGVCAIAALGFDSTEIRLIDAETHGDFTRQEDVLNLIESFAIRYAPQDVVIETVAWQRALARDERLEALGRKYGFRVHGHNTGRNKLDAVMGVAAMAGSFLRGEFRIPWKDAVSAARMEPVIAELRAWRPGVSDKLIKQDRVVTLWFGWVFILNARHGMGIKPDAWKRGGLPYHLTQPPRALKVVS